MKQVKAEIKYNKSSILLKILCPYCGKDHIHGGGNDKNHILYGFRVPHCKNNVNDGYEIIP